ncbi:hypothetical protein VP1G_11056 [Cytospora mali]|uniref:Uncharacterized protein n=1 Tax=Cytospora mali TaxID=578113 RepID=A0A194V4W1_CYTMA|nr:hypothetical protein VP1G_11056 [Valsa mali var. pyri (nom. inval.)]
MPLADSSLMRHIRVGHPVGRPVDILRQKEGRIHPLAATGPAQDVGRPSIGSRDAQARSRRGSSTRLALIVT